MLVEDKEESEGYKKFVGMRLISSFIKLSFEVVFQSTGDHTSWLNWILKLGFQEIAQSTGDHTS
jgi:hypothetical protein